MAVNKRNDKAQSFGFLRKLDGTLDRTKMAVAVAVIALFPYALSASYDLYRHPINYPEIKVMQNFGQKYDGIVSPDCDSALKIADDDQRSFEENRAEASDMHLDDILRLRDPSKDKDLLDSITSLNEKRGIAEGAIESLNAPCGDYGLSVSLRKD